MANKLMNCKTCGKEMASSAKTCPSCGAKNKKPIYKRAWFIILVIFIILIIIVPVNGGNGSTTSTTKAGAAELGKPITIGDYKVTVQKVVISKDYDGKDAITIVYDWTNNSEPIVAPMFAVSFSVFQDGKELESAIIMDNKSADSLAEARPVISVEGLSSSFITTSKNELEIEVGELISFGEPVLLKVPFPQG